MTTQTSLVAEHIRLQQWAEQIKDCQTRPGDMKVKTWCEQNGSKLGFASQKGQAPKQARFHLARGSSPVNKL